MRLSVAGIISFNLSRELGSLLGRLLWNKEQSLVLWSQVKFAWREGASPFFSGMGLVRDVNQGENQGSATMDRSTSLELAHKHPL